MLRRSSALMFVAGVHMPREQINNYQGAHHKHWPSPKTMAPPRNFKMTIEQKQKMEGIPRDTGTIPRDFLLNLMYMHQPLEVDKLWELAIMDSNCMLDSKRHVRAVLKQCREEGFCYFERDSVSDAWMVMLTRERFEEVKGLARASAEANATPHNVSVLKGSAVAETQRFADEFTHAFEGNTKAKEDHLVALSEAVEKSNAKVRNYTRTEIDYLPYTDVNGKVGFMWWYDVRDVAQDRKASETLDADLENKGAAGLPELSK